MRRTQLSPEAFGLHALCLGALLSIGCSESPPTENPNGSSDRALASPGPCELMIDPVPACAPTLDSALGGAGGAFNEALEDEACIEQSATFSCPSYLALIQTARGAQGELDVLAASLGTDGFNAEGVQINDQVHLGTYRASPDAAQESHFPIVEPYPAANEPVLWTMSSNVGDLDTRLIRQESNAQGSRLATFDFSGAKQASSDLALGLGQRLGVHHAGSAVFIDAPRVDEAGLLVQLSNEPSGASVEQEFELAFVARAVAFDTAASGETFGAFFGEKSLYLLSGDALGEPVFELELAEHVTSPDVDLRILPDQETALLLYRDSSGDYVALYVSLSDGSQLGMLEFSTTTNNCDNWYLGILCENCPVGTQCQLREDFVNRSRIYIVDERVFVASIVGNRTTDKRIELDTGLAGLGCFCSAKEVQASEIVPQLVIDEIALGTHNVNASERARYATGTASNQHVDFSRDSAGGLDIVLGPELKDFNTGLSSFPPTDLHYRILHLKGDR